MNWDWDKLQEKRQRQGSTPPPRGEGPEKPFKGFQVGDFFSKLFGRGIPIGAVLIVLLLLWLASGIFIVNPGEVGVITRFGEYSREVKDGPHYHLPYPIERAEVVVAEPLRTVVIGGLAPAMNKGQKGVHEDTGMFTGDENIVHIRFNVQYNIENARHFLFRVKEPERTVRLAAEAAMREVVGGSEIDSILTSGRALVETRAKDILEEVLNTYEVGVRVHRVQLLDVQPPPEVSEAFRNVASAREDKERFINEAEAYRMQIVPVATGRAQGMVNGAQAYAIQLVNGAQGEAARFLSMVTEFNKARDITRQRMLLEAMTEVLSSGGIQKMVISPDAKGGILPLLNLDPQGSAGFTAPPRQGGGQ